MCCILFTFTQGTVIDTSKIIKSALSSVVVISWCSWGWVAMSRSQANSSSFSLQPAFHPADSVRGTRHHGLVERPSRTRFHPLHRRSGDKPGRQISFFIVWGEDNFWKVFRMYLPVIPLWPQNLHFIWWTEAIKMSELETRNISTGKNWKDHCRCLLYESINKVQFNEVTEHKQHVFQPHCKAFSSFSSEISKVRIKRDFESG